MALEVMEQCKASVWVIVVSNQESECLWVSTGPGASGTGDSSRRWGIGCRHREETHGALMLTLCSDMGAIIAERQAVELRSWWRAPPAAPAAGSKVLPCLPWWGEGSVLPGEHSENCSGVGFHCKSMAKSGGSLSCHSTGARRGLGLRFKFK
jgi:hypothetical protein